MIKILQGDCLIKLKELEDNSVDCVVTSPPYWALRDYGVAGQLGLEPTFQEYITKLYDIFDEVKRVLKDEGTCFVNIGDTYSGSWGDSGHRPERTGIEGHQREKTTEFFERKGHPQTNPPSRKTSVPNKSLCCIPDRFKIEMINRGWICRNEIIWFKPNCMPSSVKDRFTVDYEKVFFFVKQKKYFFKTQYEPLADPERTNFQSGKRTFGVNKDRNDNDLGERSKNFKFDKGRNKRCVWQVTTKPFKEAHFATYPEKLIEPMIDAGCPVGGVVLDPFAGAGTTGVVAKKQSKDFIGIELNADYIKIAEARINAIDTSQTKLEVKSGCDANDDGIPPNNKLLGILPTIL